jgi:hypothetical protein
MLKFGALSGALLILSGPVIAEPILSEAGAQAISDELIQALRNGDISAFRKYLHPGSKLVVDLDPAPGTGQTEVSYADYMNMMEMTIGHMQGAEIYNELVSFSVNEAKGQATTHETTTTIVEMMGTKLKEVSTSKTVYGLIDGSIKVISSESELVSIESIK